MKSHYVVAGNTLHVLGGMAGDVVDRLPVGTYSVAFDEGSNQHYLEKIENFSVPSKLYGRANEHAHRFLTTFEDREHSTGALLHGDKGSGKSLTMKRTSQLAAERGYPTLVVSTAYCGEVFNKFIQNIQDPCLLVFDEFEKLYHEKEKQEQLLTLFDGMFSSKKLIMVTCNHIEKVDEHLTNRPGRMFYNLRFKGVEEQFIREYCADELANPSHVDAIVNMSVLFASFNFDMLKAIVEELNRYPGDTLKDVVKLLNVQLNASSIYGAPYDVILVLPDGTKVVGNGKTAKINPDSVRNPLSKEEVDFYYYKLDKDGDMSYEREFSVNIAKAKVERDLSKIEATVDDHKIILLRSSAYGLDYDNLLL